MMPRATVARTLEVPLTHLPVLDGDYFRLKSAIVGRPFHIYVRFPRDYVKEPGKRYPVVYLLDGDSLFPILGGAHIFLHYDEQVPDAIVVGISYGSFDPSVNKRGIDFTGPAKGVTPGAAGAAAFLQVLRQELMPAVETRYRTDPTRRLLFGQSRGGSFVLYSALHDPDLFWGRIASNPSFNPDGEHYFGSAETATRSNLGLVVASGTRDRSRQEVLRWSREWQARAAKPWALNVVTIEGGTHAADCLNAYRAGLLWLFGREREGTAR